MAKRAAYVVTGLGYGDEGKGTMTEYLAFVNEAHTVVRHNGGAQAAHNVVTPDGRHHTFQQFGSASLLEHRPMTFLSRYMLVEPRALIEEGRKLERLGVKRPFDMLRISEDAPIITPFHIAVNQLRELSRGDNRHGSCGYGVGETAACVEHTPRRAMYAEHLPKAVDRLKMVQGDLRVLHGRLIAKMRGSSAEADELVDILENEHAVEVATRDCKTLSTKVCVVPDTLLGHLVESGAVIFEGAQGVLLDKHHGSFPHVTYSNCTPLNALRLLAEASYGGPVNHVGVIRAYLTRHGAGPFPTECAKLTARMQDDHNVDNPWQRKFRVGYLDLSVLNYSLNAMRAAGAIYTEIAMTCLDRWPGGDIKMKRRGGVEIIRADLLPGYILHELGHFVGYRSYGPTVKDKIVGEGNHHAGVGEEATEVLA